MTVPFLDLAPVYSELRAQLDTALERVLAAGWFVGGIECDRFEADFATFCGARHCVGVGNGLDAIYLTLRALEVGPGDEVIVASNSYAATVLAVTMVGASPVFVEPDPATSNLDASRVEDAVSARTRAIIPTHLYGQPADLDGLIAIARRRGLLVIEDAAQAHGSRHRGARVGAHGDVVCWSFYPSKNLGALGDGGAITTNDSGIAERVRILGNYGSRERYVNEVRGVNSRLDSLHSAVLAAKLPLLDEWNSRRSRVADFYLASLAEFPIRLPHVPNWATPAWHLFAVHCPDRDGLRAVLTKQGIATQLHYPIPPHLQQAFAGLGYGAGDFPIAERLAAETLSLPIGPHLAMADAERVVDAVRDWSRTAA